MKTNLFKENFENTEAVITNDDFHQKTKENLEKADFIDINKLLKFFNNQTTSKKHLLTYQIGELNSKVDDKTLGIKTINIPNIVGLKVMYQIEKTDQVKGWIEVKVFINENMQKTKTIRINGYKTQKQKWSDELKLIAKHFKMQTTKHHDKLPHQISPHDLGLKIPEINSSDFSMTYKINKTDDELGTIDARVILKLQEIIIVKDFLMTNYATTAMVFKKMTDFLITFNEKKPFDLQNKISLDNNWNEVVKIIQEILLTQNYSKPFLDQLVWTKENGNLSDKLIENNITSTTANVTLRIGIQNLKSTKIDIYLKNIKLTDQFIVKSVAKSLNSQHQTSLKNVIPNWRDDETLDAQKLGIKLPSLQTATITFKLITIALTKGTVVVMAKIAKNQAFVEKTLTINGFKPKEISLFKKENFEKIIADLQKFNSIQQSFNLDNFIQTDHTWQDVWKLIRHHLLKNKHQKLDVQQLQWSFTASGNADDIENYYKLCDAQVFESKFFKDFYIWTENFPERKKITIYFQGLKTDQDVLNEVAINFKTIFEIDYNVHEKSDYKNWTVEKFASSDETVIKDVTIGTKTFTFVKTEVFFKKLTMIEFDNKGVSILLNLLSVQTGEKAIELQPYFIKGKVINANVSDVYISGFK